MTPLPNLPTDSLYKFIALSGIALFITGLILNFKSADVYFENSQFVKVETELSEEQKKLINSQPLFKLDDPRLLNLPIEYISKSKKNGHYLTKAEKFESYSKAMMFCGSLLTIIGFVLWYLLLQRHIDKQMKKEAEK